MKSINLSTIDLNLLVAFEALLKQQSVSGAAFELNIGQPAMSAALSRLRTLFDDQLFVRLGRKMQPTLKAQTLAPGIKEALHLIRQSIASSQTFDPITSDRYFSIGSSDYTSFVLVPLLLEFVGKSAPKLDFRMIEFDKDSIGELLEQGVIDIALGVFPNPPRQTLWEPLFEEEFVGIARRDHPALKDGAISLETFVQLFHGLSTLRRDTFGAIDEALFKLNKERRIALTTPHILTLPFAIAASDLVAAVPRRIALRLKDTCQLTLFELPVKTQPWMVSMLWSVLSDQDEANCWLRQTIKSLSKS